MKFGAMLPTAGPQASPAALVAFAERAERIGLGAVWTFERLLRPTQPIPMGGSGPTMPAPMEWATVYDPLETLSYLAATTSRIGLGTSVIDALFSSPVVLARRLATLDQLSEGRLLAGIGQGWMAQEYTAAGVPWRRRGAGFAEHIQAMRAAWGPDPVYFDGRFYQIPESEFGPKPVREGGPTLLVGAATPTAVERAARLGTGLSLVMFDWDALRDTITTFRQTAKSAGHDPSALPIVVQVNGSITAAAQDERGPLTGSVEQVAADLQQLAPLGVDHVVWAGHVVQPMDTHPDDQLDALDQLQTFAPA